MMTETRRFVTARERMAGCERIAHHNEDQASAAKAAGICMGTRKSLARR
jgi:hypothetical protein